MKKYEITLVISLILLIVCASCSTQEAEDDVIPESIEETTAQGLREQLINSGPWIVERYDVLDVKYASSDTITNEEISTHVIKIQLRDYAVDFAQDGTVTIDFPATGVHTRTWRILLGSILIFNDSQVPQFWQNATVDGASMSVDLDLYSVVEDHPAVVEHFGRLYFKSQSIQ